MNEMASVHGSTDLRDWKRFARDIVRFHMVLDL